MAADTPEPLGDGDLLSATLRLVRRHSGLSKDEVAAGMNMPVRTYHRFESGDARLNLDYIHRFARVTGTDARAILTALSIGSPAFARRAGANQLATVLMVGLKNLDAELGDDLARLDTRTLVAAVVRLCDELAAAAREPDAARDWLEDGVADLDARRPRPGRCPPDAEPPPPRRPGATPNILQI
jgi:transcriptional regulator with XRE-family HTH domain